MAAAKFDITIEQGATYTNTVFYTANLKTITSITRVANTATVTLVNHGYSTSDWILIGGADQEGYNGMVQITVSDADTFTYTTSTTPATPATSADSGRITAGKAININGFGADFQVRNKVEDTATLVDLDETSGIAITGAQGKLIISLTATETAALSFRDAVYDLEIDDGSGVVTKLLFGGVNLIKEVTR